jgi:allophanate hydrolase
VQSGGDDLISITVADAREGQMLARRLRESDVWLEVVAGIDSVVVQFDIASVARATVESVVREALVAPLGDLETTADVIEVPIAYGGESGPDLAAVCVQLGLSKCEFVDLHTAPEYEVDMLGFTPGFAYIGGLDERLNVPRLKTPRVRVPAGSVGIAGGKTGLYALQGPGGWPLVGRTTIALFDPASDDPFILVPGSKMRFVAVHRA